MPSYRWSCFVCNAGNSADAELCASCGFPAVASAASIERAREIRAGAHAAPRISSNRPQVLATVIIVPLLGILGIAASFLPFFTPPQFTWLASALAQFAVWMFPFAFAERVVGVDPSVVEPLAEFPRLFTLAHWVLLAVVSAALVRFKLPNRPLASAALVVACSTALSAFIVTAFSIRLGFWRM